MTAVIIEYADAKLLSDKHKDVIVHEGASGDVCRFDDISWPCKGSLMSADKIVAKIGTGFMDEHYTFIWVQPR